MACKECGHAIEEHDDVLEICEGDDDCVCGLYVEDDEADDDDFDDSDADDDEDWNEE